MERMSIWLTTLFQGVMNTIEIFLSEPLQSIREEKALIELKMNYLNWKNGLMMKSRLYELEF